jgi:hypothetical protein
MPPDLRRPAFAQLVITLICEGRRTPLEEPPLLDELPPEELPLELPPPEELLEDVLPEELPPEELPTAAATPMLKDGNAADASPSLTLITMPE